MLTEYDVVLVFISLVGFLVTVGGICVRLSRSITENKAAAEELRRAVEQLQKTLDIRQGESKKTHGELFTRLRTAELSLSVLQSECAACRKQQHTTIRSQNERRI